MSNFSRLIFLPIMMTASMLMAQDWVVDQSHSNETARLTYTADEGTWISLDVSPLHDEEWRPVRWQ